jgi:hypothetical protein
MGKSDVVGSWDRLCEHFPALCPVHEADDSSLTIGDAAQLRVFRLETVEPSLASQNLVAVHAWVARSESGDPTSMLELSARLPIGAVVLRDHGYELRHVVDLKQVTFVALDRMAGYLGRLGVALRERLVPGASPVAARCFEMYAEG